MSPNDKPLNPDRSSATESQIVAMAQASIDRLPGQGTNHDIDVPSSERQWNELLERVFGHLAGRDRETRSAADADVDSPQPRRDFPPDFALGRFRLIRQLGHGAYGVVMLALDRRLQREVALKLPRPELFAFGTWRSRFLDEARAVAALDHPGIVPLYEIGTIGPVNYIASAYCNGPTLAEWAKEQRPVPLDAAVRLVGLIADAVQHAHSRGILHRDLKPANVLMKLSADDESSTLPTPQVTDFGLASRLQPGNSAATSSGLAGTLAYMAPEQTFEDSSTIGTEADVYALGAILFELVTGRPPFVAEDKDSLIDQIRYSPPPDLRRLRGAAPHDVAAICDKCLAKAPADRYDTAAALAHDLRRYLAGKCIEARTARLPERIWRWCKRRPAVALLSASLIAAIVSGTIVSFVQWQRAENNLANAMTNAALATENMQQARAALLDLGWAVDDALLWQSRGDEKASSELQELTRRYAAALERLGNDPDARELQAAARCFEARIAGMQGDQLAVRYKFEQSLAAWESLVRGAPQDALYRRSLARTLYYYGVQLLTVEQQPDGLVLLTKGRLFGRFSPTEQLGRIVAFDYANVLFEKAGALRDKHYDAEAVRHYRGCRTICEQLAAANPLEPDFQFRALQCCDNLAAVEGPERSREATFQERTRVLENMRDLVRKWPARADFRQSQAQLALWLSMHNRKSGRGNDEDELLNEAITALKVAVAEPHASTAAKHLFAKALSQQAMRQLEKGTKEEAVHNAEQCLAWCDAAEREGALRPMALARTYRDMGEVLLKCGDEKKATAVLSRTTEFYELACRDAARSRAVYLQHARVWSMLASVHERAGRHASALEAANEAVGVLEQWRGPEPEEPHVASQLARLRTNVSRLESTGSGG